MVMTGWVLFNVDLVNEAHELRGALQEGAVLVGRLARAPMLLPPWIPTKTNRRIAAINHTLDTMVLRMIHDRRARGTDGPEDILGMLLHALDASAAEHGGTPPLSDRELRDELIGLFAAGQETTASLLTWTLYFLANHPEVRSKLQAEVDAVLTSPLPTPEQLPQLKYLKNVLAETLRIMPPTWGNVREAIADDVLEGRHVAAGSKLFFSPYLVHRDSRWHEHPKRYDPDRFAGTDSPATLRRFTYFPFGAGPHHCIGKFLAELEATVVLAAIVRRYDLRLIPKHTVDYQETTTVQPRGGLPMTLVRREPLRRFGHVASTVAS
jgi:cytochrome P450